MYHCYFFLYDIAVLLILLKKISLHLHTVHVTVYDELYDSENQITPTSSDKKTLQRREKEKVDIPINGP
jgi:hypothetical protein